MLVHNKCVSNIRQTCISIIYNYNLKYDKDCIDFLLKRESLDNDWKEFCSLHNLKHNTLKQINKLW